MNHLGWFGCWKHRRPICQRIQTEAAKQHIRVSRATLPGLLAVALKVTLKGHAK